MSGPSPVFITGVPRCGSSWVGEILGVTSGARYVYEPFNSQWVPSLRDHLSHFRYISPGAETRPAVSRAARLAFDGNQSTRQLKRALYRGYFRAALRPARQVLIKDPTACLMTGWLHHEYQPRVVVIHRHPCGFASSVDRLGWNFRVERLLRQDNLMREHLHPWEEILRHSRQDPWASRGAFWGAVNRVLANQARASGDWKVLSYEAICLNPAESFHSLAAFCGLNLNSGQVAARLARRTKSGSDSGSTIKDSLQMVEIWKNRMTGDEIDTVMGTAEQFGLADLPGWPQPS